MNSRRFKLAHRLALGFGVVLLLLAISTLSSVIVMRDTAARTTVINDDLGPKAELVARLKQSVNQSALAIRNMAILESANLPPEYKRLTESYAAYDKAAATLADKIRTSASSSQEEQALVQRIASAKQEASAVFNAAVQRGGSNATVEDVSVLLRLELRTNLDAWSRAQNQLLESIDALSSFIGQETARHQQSVTRQIANGTTITSIVALTALVLGAAAAWSITRSVTQPVRDAIAVADRMAAGDLSMPIKTESTHEIGQLIERLESMRLKWIEAVTRLLAATNGIRSAGGDITTGTVDLRQRTEQAGESLQHVSASMNTITATVARSTASARKANQLASSAASVAAVGGEVVQKVTGAMNEIDAGSKRIAEITGVINAIAFQTNILALNAAVEAARAGEHGRGFAVVASEVRTLAQRAATAAKEIEALIRSSVSQVELGSSQVVEAGLTMDKIVASVKDVTDVIGEIDAVCAAQRTDIDKMSTSMDALNTSTRQNAVLVEQNTSASGQLRDQTNRLNELVQAFKLPA